MLKVEAMYTPNDATIPSARSLVECRDSGV